MNFHKLDPADPDTWPDEGRWVMLRCDMYQVVDGKVSDNAKPEYAAAEALEWDGRLILRDYSGGFLDAGEWEKWAYIEDEG